MRRLLVTGGAGFIGSNFVQHWIRGHAGDWLVVLDALTYAGNRMSLAPVETQPGFGFIHGNICDGNLVTSLLREERIDTLVHFAAETHVDEGGGYYDSGDIQPVDFFGDGTRIPLIAVSPYARPGHVDHTYYDHASVLKFIERNWGLGPLSARSRDNLPNPVQKVGDYMPSNVPAIGDLTNLFDFAHLRADAPKIKQVTDVE